MNFKFENPSYDWNVLKNYDLQKLNNDEAILNVTSLTNHPIWMYSLVSECHKCPFTLMREIKENSSEYFVIDTVYDQIWKFYDSDRGDYLDAGDT